MNFCLYVNKLSRKKISFLFSRNNLLIKLVKVVRIKCIFIIQIVIFIIKSVILKINVMIFIIKVVILKIKVVILRIKNKGKDIEIEVNIN